LDDVGNRLHLDTFCFVDVLERIHFASLLMLHDANLCFNLFIDFFLKNFKKRWGMSWRLADLRSVEEEVPCQKHLFQRIVEGQSEKD
jgi:hypothetical protein